MLKLVAALLFVLALICLLVPTTLAGAGWQVWTVAGLLAWVLSNSFVVVRRRRRRDARPRVVGGTQRMRVLAGLLAVVVVLFVGSVFAVADYSAVSSLPAHPLAAVLVGWWEVVFIALAGVVVVAAAVAGVLELIRGIRG